VTHLKSIGGFTLIEILVLIVIAGILLPVIIVPFVTAVKGSTKPEKVATAMYLGHQKMEEMMKFDYGRSPDLDPAALTPYADIDPSNFPGYQWQKEIVYVDSDFTVSVTNRGYKRILVRVRDPENSVYEIHSMVTDFP
jgi:type II secretory pathway pseudopilin PulG